MSTERNLPDFERIDPERVEDPDSLGDCENCGGAVGHDEYAVQVQRGYNCHGIFMSENNTVVYHRDCFEEVIERGGRVERPSRRHGRW